MSIHIQQATIGQIEELGRDPGYMTDLLISWGVPRWGLRQLIGSPALDTILEDTFFSQDRTIELLPSTKVSDIEHPPSSGFYNLLHSYRSITPDAVADLTVDQVSYLMQGIQYANIESDEDMKHTAIILQNRKKNASISEEDRGKIDAMWERVDGGTSGDSLDP